jgi:hypothetical protein
MMAEPLPKEIIQKARELVLCGNSKYSVAKELGIGITTIYKHTMDLPSNKHNRLDRKTIQKIREEVLQGKSKYQIAKDMDLRFGVVYYHTQDLPHHMYREEGVQGEVLDLLKELMKDGYVLSTAKHSVRLRRLKKQFPMVKRAEVNKRTVYYLADKNKMALQSIVALKKSKIFSYQELSSMSRILDVKLSKKEKKFILSQKNKDKTF